MGFDHSPDQRQPQPHALAPETRVRSEVPGDIAAFVEFVEYQMALFRLDADSRVGYGHLGERSPKLLGEKSRGEEKSINMVRTIRKRCINNIFT